jgi:hypothetical protein
MNYGQFVAFALGDGTAIDAMRASDILAVCGNEEKLRSGLDGLKGKIGVSAEKLASLINDSEATLRQCQAVPADLYQNDLLLAEKALRGKVLGAAVRYGDKISYRPSPEMAGVLLDGLRSDSTGGDKAAMNRLVLHGRDLGLDVVEVHAYHLLTTKLGKKNQNELLSRVLQSRGVIDLTPEQRIAAEGLAENLYRQLSK